MDFFDAVKKRGCYRGEFTEKKIPREELCQIVQAGIQAPSGCNAQTTTFVIVDDPDLIRKTAEILGKPFCATAAALIVCVAEDRAVFADMSFYKEDCAAATENILLALTALGYASVWLDGVLRVGEVAKKIGDLLGVPAGKQVQIVLPVGEPAKPFAQNSRLPFDQRAWFNHYGQ